jgi:hypothetical protein
MMHVNFLISMEVILCHIGGKQVFHYDDLKQGKTQALYESVGPRVIEEFVTGQRRNSHPDAALYFLVSGEVTQDALYCQRKEYLDNNFGILFGNDPNPQNGPAVSLHPKLAGQFVKLPQNVTNTHWNHNHKEHATEFQYDWKRPKPRLLINVQPPPTSQVTGEDPIEKYRSALTSPAPMRNIISPQLDQNPPTLDMLQRAPHELSSMVKWDIEWLEWLDLWDVVDGSEELADTLAEEEAGHAAKHLIRLESASPPRRTKSKKLPMKVPGSKLCCCFGIQLYKLIQISQFNSPRYRLIGDISPKKTSLENHPTHDWLYSHSNKI